MSANITTTREATTTEREAVTVAAKATLASAVTLTKRAATLAEALATLQAKAEAVGTFRQYVTLATEALQAAGDWTKADTEARKAVAVIAGTSGGLSSVMVAEAVGLSQSTASRVIRQAKAVTVAEATEAAKAEATERAEADGLTKAEAAKAGREAAEAAKAKAEREASRVITRSGLTLQSGRAANGTTTRKGASVAKALTEATTTEALTALADGTVAADDLRALAATLAGMAERIAEAAPSVAEREAERVAAEAAEAEAKATERAEREAAKATEREAKATERAEAKAKREAAKAEAKAERETKAEAKRVRPLLAVTMGDEAVAALTDREAITRARIVAEAATLALAEAKA